MVLARTISREGKGCVCGGGGEWEPNVMMHMTAASKGSPLSYIVTRKGASALRCCHNTSGKRRLPLALG